MEGGVVSSSGPAKDAPAVPLRRGILMVLWGPNAFRKVVLDPGQSITVGRTERADVVVPDSDLGGQHFSIWFSGKRAIVRDLDTVKGTAINGQQVGRGEIEHGGFIVAGTTTFQLFLEGFTPPLDEPATVERLRQVEVARAAIGPADGTLYAVMDAARDDKVRWILQESIDAHENLYEGFEGRVLDDVAPYLVRFDATSDLLERLLIGGWGNGWGVFLRSLEPPKEVRRHLRRFLMVQDEESLERLYFRFYDPRVLRDFATVVTPRQRQELLAALTSVTFENEDGSAASLVKEGGS